MKKNEYKTKIYYIVKMELKNKTIKKIVEKPQQAQTILTQHIGELKKYEIYQVTKITLKTVQWIAPKIWG